MTNGLTIYSLPRRRGFSAPSSWSPPLPCSGCRGSKSPSLNALPCTDNSSQVTDVSLPSWTSHRILLMTSMGFADALGADVQECTALGGVGRCGLSGIDRGSILPITCNEGDAPMLSPNAERVRRRRDVLRALGLRPVQIWVPDTRRKGFAEECRRQSRLLRHAAHDADVTQWIEDAGDTTGWQ